jgi:hypothetical protein
VRLPLPPPGWKRWLAIAAVLVLALRAALPFALEKLAESQGSAALGLPLRVGDVDLQLVRGGLAIEKLQIGDKHQPLEVETVDPSTALLSLERIYARIGWLDLLRGRIRLRELELDAPTVRVSRELDGRIAPLPEPPAQPLAAEEPEEDGAGALPIAVDRFALRSAQLELIALDEPVRELVGFGLEELTVADFALDEEGISLGVIGIRRPRVDVQHELAMGQGGAAAATGEPPPVGAAPDEQAPAQPAAAAPDFNLKHVAIENASFSLQMPESALDVKLSLSADEVTAKRGATFPARLALELAQGTLEAEGLVGADPLLFDGTLRWQGLALPLLLEPLPPGPTDWLTSATARGDLKLAARLAPADGAAPELRVSGALGLADLAARDPDRDLALAWKSLELDIQELHVPLASQGAGAAAPPRVVLRKLRLVDPVARVVVQAGEEADAAEEEDGAPAPVDSGPPAAQPQVSLGALELVGGRVEFIDRSISPEYRAQLRKLNVGARELRWPQGDVRDLRAGFVGPAEAVLDLRGGLRGRVGELQLSLDRLALAGFNPYAKSLAGLEVARGSFSLDTRAQAQTGNWSLQNDLVIHDLSLESGGSGMLPGIGFPISTVLALLRDPQGDISLGVPVRFDAAGARAGLGSILLDALRQTVVGVVSTPLKALGFVAEAAAGDHEAYVINCAPGSVELAEGEAELLGPIAALLSERPTLAVTLRGRSGPVDRAPVAEQALREAIEADTAPDLPGSSFLQRRRLRRALEERGRGETPELEAEDREALERWIAAMPVAPERLQDLAAMRAELLLETFATLHAVPRARLSLADPIEGEPAVKFEIAAMPGS